MRKGRLGEWQNSKSDLAECHDTKLKCIMNNVWWNLLAAIQRFCGASVMKRKVVRPVLSLNTQRVYAFIFDTVIATAIVILSFVTL